MTVSTHPSARRSGLLVGLVALGLAAGGGCAVLGSTSWAHYIWIATTAAGLVPAVLWTARTVREHRLGADVVAVLALLGTIVAREYLAGAVISLMLASGRGLEAMASARAQRELRALIAHAPRIAHRYADASVTSVPIEDIAPGDLLLVKPGEIVGVDGLVESAAAVLDESTLTGEAMPVERTAGDDVRSGAVNAGAAFDLRATTTAEAGTYAAIVRLVQSVEASSAPLVRVADRYAGGFAAVAVLCAVGAWAVSGDFVRAVAVLVVATPCPLILAAPVAIVAGLSRAAGRGVVIKGGGVLERLATVDTLLMDKTGTVTAGHPRLVQVVAPGSWREDDVLRLAASLDQVSPHILAAAVVRAARDRGAILTMPSEVQEVAGSGVRGRVGDDDVAVGTADWVDLPSRAWSRAVRRRSALDGTLVAFLEVNGDIAGALVFEDPIRPDAGRTIRGLRRAGIRRIALLSGDHEDVAKTIGAALGADDVFAERTPADKAAIVLMERDTGTVAMVGDGINDAPALAAADVGVAMGARGASAASEAADVVLTVDRIDRLGEVVLIARKARRIAAQSALVGMGLSVVAMGFAAAGLVRPAWGALLQELIDVGVILNALRARLGGPVGARLGEPALGLAKRFKAEHHDLEPRLDGLRAAADALGASPPRQALARVEEVHQFLVHEVLPHEEAEDKQLYPAMGRVLGGDDPTATMSRAHVEIAHLVGRIGSVLGANDEDELGVEDVAELRRLLYGLHAILKLHFAQENETYFSLVDSAEASRV